MAVAPDVLDLAPLSRRDRDPLIAGLAFADGADHRLAVAHPDLFPGLADATVADELVVPIGLPVLEALDLEEVALYALSGGFGRPPKRTRRARSEAAGAVCAEPFRDSSRSRDRERPFGASPVSLGGKARSDAAKSEHPGFPAFIQAISRTQ